MNKQPELPDLVRDLEIMQSLNRNLATEEDLAEDFDVMTSMEVSDGSVSP